MPLVPSLFRTAVFALLAVPAAASTAFACGGTPTSMRVLTTGDDTVFAGTRALLVTVRGVGSDAPLTFRLRQTPQGSDALIDVPVSVMASEQPEVHALVLPSGTAVVVGTLYRLDVSLPSSASFAGWSEEVRFSGVSAPALPSMLGTLHAEPVRRGGIAQGVCGGGVPGVETSVRLSPSEAARPWARAIAHQLRVDGEPGFPGLMPFASITGEPEELAVRPYAACAAGVVEGPTMRYPGVELALTPGTHTLQWESSLPDGTVLVSDEVQVELRCDPDLPRATPDDAGSPPSVQDDSASPAGTRPTSVDDASGCSLGGRSGGGGSALILALAALSRSRRRRRARAARPQRAR